MNLVDNIVVLAYLSVSVVAGIWLFRPRPTVDDFLFGARSVPQTAIALSLFATSLSTLSLVNIPAEIVRSGSTLAFHLLGLPIAFVLVAQVALPAYYRHDSPTTIFAYLRTRFGRHVELGVTSIFVCARLARVATILYTSSYVIAEATAAPLLVIMAGITGIGIFYVSFGGIRADIYTDVFQGVVMVIMVVATLVGCLASLDHSSHWTSFWSQARIHAPVIANMSEVSVVAILVWTVCIMFTSFAADQVNAQIYFCSDSERAARRAVYRSMWITLGMSCLLVVLGLAIYAYYANDPLIGAALIAQNADGLLTSFVRDRLPPGFLGLFACGLLAASISSIDSVVQAFNAIYRVNVRGESADELKLATITPAYRCATAVTAAVAVALAATLSLAEGSLLRKAAVLNSIFEGPLGGIFAAAFCSSQIRPFHLYLGAAFGLLSAILLTIGPSIFGITSISFFWFLPISFATTVVTVLGASSCSRFRRRFHRVS